MHEIITLLHCRGIACLNVTLRGHDGDYQALQSVTMCQWMADVRNALKIARRWADRLGVPVVITGYSLGCLVASQLQIQADTEWRSRDDHLGDGGAVCDGFLFFAPALRLHRRAQMLKALMLFPCLSIPSASRAIDRVHTRTPMAAYNALFFGCYNLDAGGFKHLIHIPTFVCVDVEDELVSVEHLQKTIHAYASMKWQFYLIRQTRPIRHYHHLIFSKQDLGEKIWQNVSTNLSHFIEQEIYR